VIGYDLLGFVGLSALTLLVGYGFATRARSPFPARLVLLALAMRIVGSTVRFDMIRLFYGGLADAQRYFNSGREFAARIWGGEPLLFSAEYWFGSGRWWGTDFMERLTGLVITFIGPTMRGTYLVFSLASFAGIYLIALAVHHQRPGPGAARYATWIWLWPSLWFWPSSIGKEAVTVLAIGLVFFGYAGGRRGIRWLPFLAGLGLAFALRPHVGAALALATLAAYWFRSWERFGMRRIFESILALVLAAFVLTAMAGQFGLDADLEGAQEFVTYRTGQTMEGGSRIGGAARGPFAIPTAFVNIWLRPFPWDVHNLMALFAALEVMFLAGYAIMRRRSLLLALRHWRRDRMLGFALPFLAGYTLMIGLTFANLGIIARQRSPLYPFVFLLLSAAGTYAVAARRRGGPARTAWPRPPAPARQAARRRLDVPASAPWPAAAPPPPVDGARER
jgi:hypothetical protein